MAAAPDSDGDAGPLRANQRAREDLAASYRGLDYYNLGEGICNHLTLMAPSRDGSGKVMLVAPYGIHWSQVTASCFVGLDIHTKEIVEGNREERCLNESGVEIHTAIYRSCGDAVQCVMHIHPPYTTALSCLKDPRLRNIHQTSMRFHGKVAYDLDYGGTGEMGDEGTRLAEKMAGKRIMVMGNHGVISVGKSAAVVFDDLYYFERAVMFQMIADATGKELADVSDKVAQGVADHLEGCGDGFKIQHFEAIKKVLENKAPDFRS